MKKKIAVMSLLSIAIGTVGIASLFYSSTLAFPKLPKDTIVIFPLFTYAAYQPHGFYTYYAHKCNTQCLTVRLPDRVSSNRYYRITGRMSNAASMNGLAILKRLGYRNIVTDVDVTLNPSILDRFQRVIMLHSEYVTKQEFDAITKHPNVTFLYPNALYAQVVYHPNDNTITLVKGHGYKGFENAFGWSYSTSTKDEYKLCLDFHFRNIGNGDKMIDCYPEHTIIFDPRLWNALENAQAQVRDQEAVVSRLLSKLGSGGLAFIEQLADDYDRILSATTTLSLN